MNIIHDSLNIELMDLFCTYGYTRNKIGLRCLHDDMTICSNKGKGITLNKKQ